MERTIDFNRVRRVRCGRCSHEWAVDLEWLDRWGRRDEACPTCGTTCDAEEAAQVTADSNDPVLDDSTAKTVAWYHSTTHDDWPPTIDFAARIDPQMRRQMGEEEAGRWIERQHFKALHLGTYESAIQNMLRRIHDQADGGKQFYLYRVQIMPETVIRPGWVPDPSDWLGDVYTDEDVFHDVDAVRYVNHHEDPGQLSFAIRTPAIKTTQRQAIPLTVESEHPNVREIVRRLSAEQGGPTRKREVAKDVAAQIADRLPISLREQFEWSTSWENDAPALEWARYLVGVAALIESPAKVLSALDAQPVRRPLGPSGRSHSCTDERTWARP